jgi:FixJ family two-component response regulator
MPTSTVHIVDDDVSLCRAIGRLLRTHNYNVLCYSSPSQFLARPILQGPACLLLDLKMPEYTGLDLQEMLAHRDGLLPIIFMSGFADIETSVRAMKAGAVDFLTKPFDEQHLLSAVESALALSEQAQAKRDKVRKDQAAFVSLTRREREVCLRIAQGLLNKQVGYELGTSEKTVKSQRARVMQKLGADSLPDIVRLVERLRAAGTIPETQSHSNA